jgi:hypothetical protein
VFSEAPPTRPANNAHTPLMLVDVAPIPLISAVAPDIRHLPGMPAASRLRADRRFRGRERGLPGCFERGITLKMHYEPLLLQQTSNNNKSSRHNRNVENLFPHYI